MSQQRPKTVWPWESRLSSTDHPPQPPPLGWRTSATKATRRVPTSLHWSRSQRHHQQQPSGDQKLPTERGNNQHDANSGVYSTATPFSQSALLPSPSYPSRSDQERQKNQYSQVPPYLQSPSKAPASTTQNPTTAANFRVHPWTITPSVVSTPHAKTSVERAAEGYQASAAAHPTKSVVWAAEGYQAKAKPQNMSLNSTLPMRQLQLSSQQQQTTDDPNDHASFNPWMPFGPRPLTDRVAYEFAAAEREEHLLAAVEKLTRHIVDLEESLAQSRQLHGQTLSNLSTTVREFLQATRDDCVQAAEHIANKQMLSLDTISKQIVRDLSEPLDVLIREQKNLRESVKRECLAHSQRTPTVSIEMLSRLIDTALEARQAPSTGRPQRPLIVDAAPFPSSLAHDVQTEFPLSSLTPVADHRQATIPEKFVELVSPHDDEDAETVCGNEECNGEPKADSRRRSLIEPAFEDSFLNDDTTMHGVDAANIKQEAKLEQSLWDIHEKMGTQLPKVHAMELRSTKRKLNTSLRDTKASCSQCSRDPMTKVPRRR